MAKAPFALLLAGALAPCGALGAADAKSADLRVSVRVVSSCGVRVNASGAIGVRCARGAADRVLIADAEPRVVTLTRDASRVVSTELQSDGTQGASSSERFVTLQF
jgi:hypothetical protein